MNDAMCGEVLDHRPVRGRFFKDGGCHDTRGETAGGMRIIVQAEELDRLGIKMKDEGAGGVTGGMIAGDIFIIGYCIYQ